MCGCAGVTHVIVDEVHERAIMTDFALAILRDLLVHRPDVRLVLVSIPPELSATKPLKLCTA